MRTLAIDYGSKRIGLAMSDEGGRFTTPIDVLQVASREMALDTISKLAAKESVQQLLVGLPLNMDDTVGPQAKLTIEWAKALAERTKLPVVFVDERLSSFAAEQSLIERKRGGERLTRQDKKERLDALVAAAMLQEFLDGKLPSIKTG